MIISKERVLSREEVREYLENMNQKRTIKYLSCGVAGLSVANIIVKYSERIDSFFFNDIGDFLNGSKYNLMSIPIPNWFILACLGGYGTVSFFVIYNKYIKELKK